MSDKFSIVNSKSIQAQNFIILSNDGKYVIHWDNQKIELKNKEDAKTLCLLLFRGIFE